MAQRTMPRRTRLALGLLVALLSAACQSGTGVGMDLNSGGPAWGPFSSGVMFGAPAW